MSSLEMIAKEHNFKRLNMKNTEKHISIQKYKDAMLELENVKEKLSEYDDLILDTKREINALEASSEPLFFKRLLDTLLEFIDKIIMPFLPKELADRIDKILGSRTYGELENAIINEIDGVDIDYDY